MLFKSKGSNRYVNYTFDQFFYDSQYIKNYFQPLLKVSAKNISTFSNNTFENNMIFMFVKNVKKESNVYYSSFKDKCKQLSMDKQFSRNDKLMFIQVTDEHAAETLGMAGKQDGDIVLAKRQSKLNRYRSDLSL